MNLTGASLAGVIKITGAKLTNINLSGVDFTPSSANQRRFKSIGADLKGANLTKAKLTEAVLTNANVTGTDLTGANSTNLVIRALAISSKLGMRPLMERVLSRREVLSA